MAIEKTNLQSLNKQKTSVKLATDKVSNANTNNNIIINSENTNTIHDKNINTWRPQNFTEYIGQEKLKLNLSISINAAEKRQDKSSIGHILLYGAPGLGKTSMAYLLAGELETQAHFISAPSLDKPKDIIGLLLNLQEGDILFIDEIHRLNRITEEILYSAMEDYTIELTSGKASTARVKQVPLKKFILIGATTKLASISAPLKDRFKHVYQMQYYSEQELSQIILNNKSNISMKITSDIAESLAQAARGTPRIALRLLKLLDDYALYHNTQNISHKFLTEMFENNDIDNNGLQQIDRKILEILVHKFSGKPVGLETIAASLGEDSQTIETYYEPYLLQKSLIQKTTKGRQATPMTYKYLGLKE